MASKNSYPGINPKIVQVIQYYARSLKDKKYCIHETIEDIEQELLVECWPELSKYDELDERFDAFVGTLIRSRARNLKKKYLCKKRAIDFVDDTEEELNEKESKSFEYESAVRIDVNEVVAKLPQELKELCELLKHYSICEVSKKTGIAKSSIHNKIKKLREHEKFSLLKPYLKQSL